MPAGILFSVVGAVWLGASFAGPFRRWWLGYGHKQQQALGQYADLVPRFLYSIAWLRTSSAVMLVIGLGLLAAAA